MPDGDEKWERDLARERRLLDEAVATSLNMPPQFLVDMRLVYGNQPLTTDGQLRMKAIWEKDPDRFLSRWQSAEREYRAGVSKGKKGEETPEDVPEAPDEGTERVLELLAEEWAHVRRVVRGDQEAVQPVPEPAVRGKAAKGTEGDR